MTAKVDGERVSITDFELEQLIAWHDDDNSGELDLPELESLLNVINVQNPKVVSSITSKR